MIPYSKDSQNTQIQRLWRKSPSECMKKKSTILSLMNFWEIKCLRSRRLFKVLRVLSSLQVRKASFVLKCQICIWKTLWMKSLLNSSLLNVRLLWKLNRFKSIQIITTLVALLSINSDLEVHDDHEDSVFEQQKIRWNCMKLEIVSSLKIKEIFTQVKKSISLQIKLHLLCSVSRHLRTLNKQLMFQLVIKDSQVLQTTG